MITSRAELVRAVTTLQSAFPEEQQFRDAFLALLQAGRCFHRDHLPGHITGSAFIIDESGTHALLTHHAKLNRWLQPGGHADGDENVLRVALREAAEETGLSDFKILSTGLFDIDIHTIPARPDFPAHEHYDIRFLLQAGRQQQLQISEESHDLAWVPLIDLRSLTGNDSITRMVEKIQDSKIQNLSS